MAFKKVAEISIDKLEDRKTVTAILHANDIQLVQESVRRHLQGSSWTII